MPGRSACTCWLSQPALLSGVNRPGHRRTSPAGTHRRRPLQIATGSKTSSLTGDAREHSADRRRSGRSTASARRVWARDLDKVGRPSLVSWPGWRGAGCTASCWAAPQTERYVPGGTGCPLRDRIVLTVCPFTHDERQGGAASRPPKQQHARGVLGRAGSSVFFWTSPPQPCLTPASGGPNPLHATPGCVRRRVRGSAPDWRLGSRRPATRRRCATGGDVEHVGGRQQSLTGLLAAVTHQRLSPGGEATQLGPQKPVGQFDAGNPCSRFARAVNPRELVQVHVGDDAVRHDVEAGAGMMLRTRPRIAAGRTVSIQVLHHDGDGDARDMRALAEVLSTHGAEARACESRGEADAQVH